MATTKPAVKVRPTSVSRRKGTVVGRESPTRGCSSAQARTSLQSRRDHIASDEDDESAWQDLKAGYIHQDAPLGQPMALRAEPSSAAPLDLFRPLRLCGRLMWLLVRWTLPWIASSAVMVMLAFVAYLAARQALVQAISGVTSVVMLPATLLTRAYCSTIKYGCVDESLPQSTRMTKPLAADFIATSAHETSLRAGQALDLFQSFADLGGPNSEGLALHSVPLWELSRVVRHGTNLDEREFLSNQLGNLGDGIRQLKDQIIKVNSQGHATFKWTLQDFTRLQQVIEQAQSSPEKYTEDEMSDLLSKFFERMDDKMGRLLESLEKVIPVAEKVSSHSRLIRETFSDADSSALAKLNQLSINKFIPHTTDRWKYLQLQKDLQMTNASVEVVGQLLFTLENTRDSLVAYRESVGHYKANIIGYYLSGMSLTVESEVKALGSVMKDFRLAIDKPKPSTAVDSSS
ncbi:hypothetical protein OIV83_002530 [Microbotryomycetes sp. JL201]|nr:hypothetical protein OIV83_002530 [Microbotryomycetes sp. JL201]